MELYSIRTESNIRVFNTSSLNEKKKCNTQANPSCAEINIKVITEY